MNDDEIVIRIKEDKTVKVEITENGESRTKHISPDTLFDCIKGSMQPKSIGTGILPKNIISVTTDSVKDSHFVTMEYQYDKSNITYMNSEYKDFPLPRLVFGFQVDEKGKIEKVKLGVIEQGKLRPEAKMYYYPFSNVSGFSLCIGANSMPIIKSLQNLENMPEYILSLPNNDDHYDSKNNKLKLGHRDLLEHLVDKDRQYYYDSILIPMPNRTLKDFI